MLKRCAFGICLAICTGAIHAQDVPVPLPPNGGIAGTVLDTNQEIVPRATVTLHCDAPCKDTSTTAGDAGDFHFDKLALDIPYRLTVTADGFAEWSSPAIILRVDQSFSYVTNIQLRLAVTDSVTVYASSNEIATEQVHLQEQQRVLGFIPNFYVVYDSANAVPLPTSLKFKLAMRAALDPVTIAGVGFLSGVQQAGGTPNYVQGAKGYGQRFGANAADGFSNILIGGAVLPSLLHQDPRYFYQGTGTTRSRLKHALLSPFICRGDNGRSQVNFSTIGGDLASSALSNAYYPDSNRGAGLMFGNFAIDTGERVISDVMQQFVLRRLTPSARKPK